jgi:hypothetical protein
VHKTIAKWLLLRYNLTTNTPLALVLMCFAHTLIVGIHPSFNHLQLGLPGSFQAAHVCGAYRFSAGN